MNKKRIIGFSILAATVVGCLFRPADHLLFRSEPASLDDYDFTSDDLDGIDPERITSEMILSGSNGKRIHVIYVTRDVDKLDPRIPESEGATILFSHGTGGNMLYYWYRLAYFHDMGFNVAMYDYRGYGASEGTTSEPAIYEDAATVYDYLRAKEDVGAIIAAGFSMGGAPTAWLCAPESGREITACFIESTFSSAKRFLNEHDGLFSTWYLKSDMNNEARLKTVSIPVLLTHGTEDQTVSFKNAKTLWTAVEGRHPLNRFFPVDGATHANVPVPSLGKTNPADYSHPDELPEGQRDDFDIHYKARLIDFIADSLGQ